MKKYEERKFFEIKDDPDLPAFIVSVNNKFDKLQFKTANEMGLIILNEKELLSYYNVFNKVVNYFNLIPKKKKIIKKKTNGKGKETNSKK